MDWYSEFPHSNSMSELNVVHLLRKSRSPDEGEDETVQVLHSMPLRQTDDFILVESGKDCRDCRFRNRICKHRRLMRLGQVSVRLRGDTVPKTCGPYSRELTCLPGRRNLTILTESMRPLAVANQSEWTQFPTASI